jgi:hypothetical protein
MTTRISGGGRVEPERNEGDETPATEQREERSEPAATRGSSGLADRAARSGGAVSDSKLFADIKQQYEDNGMTGTDVKRSDLPPAAQKQFDKDMKQWGPDYPPQANKMVIDGKTVYGIEVDNDGGSYANFYDESGKKLASYDCSESGSPTWEK